MTTEALLAVGRPDSVLPCAENYRRRLADRPPLLDAIDPLHWQDALGEVRRVSDWSVFVEPLIEEEGW